MGLGRESGRRHRTGSPLRDSVGMPEHQSHTHTHTHANTLGGCGATIMYNGYGAIMTVSGCLVMSWLQSPQATVEGVWGWQWESLWEPLSVY